MKWKTPLLLSLAALLIAGAFVVPPLLLQRSVSRLVNKPILTDASVPDVKPAESIVEKLASFSDPDSTSVSLGTETNDEQLTSVLHEELRSLYEAGALLQTAYDSLVTALDEGFDAERYCVIQPAHHLMFEVFSVEIWNAQILLDWSSLKILSINYSMPGAALLRLECDEVQARREMQGWADYLGLTAGQFVLTEMSIDEILSSGQYKDPVILKQCVLTDETGAGILFGQSLTFGVDTDNYIWHPIY